MINLQKTVLPVAVLLALTFPAAACADQTAPKQISFQTSEVDVDHPDGAIEGSLNVTIAADGTISGYFHRADSGRSRDVHGALTGKTIYLDIGNQVPVEGTYVNGTIVGYRTMGKNRHLDQYRFTATPAP